MLARVLAKMAMQSGEKTKPVYEIIADELKMVTGLPVAIISFRVDRPSCFPEPSLANWKPSLAC